MLDAEDQGAGIPKGGQAEDNEEGNEVGDGEAFGQSEGPQDTPDYECGEGTEGQESQVFAQVGRDAVMDGAEGVAEVVGISHGGNGLGYRLVFGDAP